jgi:hypothetical protein
MTVSKTHPLVNRGDIRPLQKRLHTLLAAALALGREIRLRRALENYFIFYSIGGVTMQHQVTLKNWIPIVFSMATGCDPAGSQFAREEADRQSQQYTLRFIVLPRRKKQPCCYLSVN